MKKISVLIAIVLISLLAIGAVSAADDIAATDDANAVDLGQSIDIDTETNLNSNSGFDENIVSDSNSNSNSNSNLNTNINTNDITSDITSDNSIRENNESNTLSSSNLGATSFEGLQDEINRAGGHYDLSLNIRYDGDDRYKNGIIINKDIVIDGNRHVIFGENAARSFSTLNNLIMSSGENTTLALDGDYSYYSELDSDLVGGIPIVNRNLVIEGNNHTIDAKGLSRIFNVTDSSFTINNVVLCNAFTEHNGGAILASRSNFTASNVSFINNTASDHSGGALALSASKSIISDSIFENNKGKDYCAIYSMRNSAAYYTEIHNCSFTNNDLSNTVIGSETELTITDSRFVNNSITNSVISSIDIAQVRVSNSNFTENSGNYVIIVGDESYFYLYNSNFSDNIVENAIILNEGTLYLERNNIDKVNASIVNNDALSKITSLINVEILDNGTATFIDGTALLTAKITDDNGNLIDDENFYFIVNDTECAVEFDDVDMLYELNVTQFSLGITVPKAYLVNIANNVSKNLAVKTGVLRYDKGSISELSRLVKEAEDTLVLDHDFAYNPELDEIFTQVNVGRNITIDGNGHSIDADNKMDHIFYMGDGGTLENLNLKNTLRQAVYNTDLGNDLTIKNTNFTDCANPIYNGEGKALTLIDVSSNKGTIQNYGRIESPVTVEVLENSTVDSRFNNIVLSAKVYADDILIDDESFIFELTHIDSGEAETLLPENRSGIYSASFTPKSTGAYLVSMKSENYNNLTVKTGILNVFATFTDLNELVSEIYHDNTLVLEMDYTYNENFDSDLVNGIVIDHYLKINGNHVISGNNQSRIFNITNSAYLRLNNLTISDAKGGAITVAPASALNLKGVTFVDNKFEEGSGGAINLERDSTLYASDTNFINCSAKYGGAISSESEMSLIRTNFIDCSGDFGSAIFLYGKASLSDCQFIGNNASYSVIENSGVLIISDSQFINDSSEASIISSYNNITLSNSNFENIQVSSGYWIKIEGGSASFAKNNVSKSEPQISRFNDAVIDSDVVLEILGNKSVIGYGNFDITAKLMDDNGNLIYDDSSVDSYGGSSIFFNIINNGTTNRRTGNFDTANSEYYTKYEIDPNEVYLISADPLGNYSKFDIKTGVIANISGSLTELAQLISESNDTLVLNQDYAYNPKVDKNDSIIINNDVEIDANGHTIDFKGTDGGIIVNSICEIKNLIINDAQNGIAVDKGHAIVKGSDLSNVTFSVINGGKMEVYDSILNNGINFGEMLISNNTLNLFDNSGNISLYNNTLNLLGNSGNMSLYNNTLNLLGNRGNMSLYNNTLNLIDNEGHLELSGNTITLINNTKGFIDSTVNVVVNNNETVTAHALSPFYASAKITDDNNNPICDNDFTFELVNVDTGYPIAMDTYSNYPYLASIIAEKTGTYLVTVKNDFYNLNVSTSMVSFFATLSDLDALIKDYSEGSVIDLDMDYGYDSIEDSHLKDGIIIDKNITIIGNGHYVNGNNMTRLFNQTAGTFTLEDIFLADTNSSVYGAIAVQGGNLVLKNASITNAVAEGTFGFGGAIYLASGTSLEAYDSEFVNCSGNMGGAIHGFKATIDIDKCNFTSNQAVRGSAIFADADLTVKNSKFTDNKAKDSSTIYSLNRLNVDKTEFANNSANSSSAIYIKGKGIISESNFNNNNASDFGTVAVDGEVEIEDSQFLNNTVEKAGGAIYVYNNSILSVDASDFAGNKANECFNIYLPSKNGDTVSLELYDCLFDAIVSLEVEDVLLGEDAIINGTLDTGISYNDIDITYKLNGQKDSVPTENGTFSIILHDLSLGNYTVDISNFYDDEDNSYIFEPIIKTFEVLKEQAVFIGIATSNITYGDKAVINFTVTNQDGSPIDTVLEVSVKDLLYNVTVSDGVGSLNISNLSADTYPVIANYLGDHTHIPSINASYFTVSKNATVIVFKDMTTTAIDKSDVKTGQWFTWKLVDANGNPIANVPTQIGFNGVVYENILTDANGLAKLQINLAYKGPYTFAISFLGNQNYNASFVVAKITVNTQTPNMAVPNKSYKAAAKTKTLTATFKSVKGTLIANKKVSFTVNGKTYAVKTNAKGVATVKVSITKKGTYKVVAKFAGDSTYSAVKKTATLKIS